MFNFSCAKCWIPVEVFITAMLMLAGSHALSWQPPRAPRYFEKGEITTIFSPGDYDFHHIWYTVQDRTNFIFHVKSCRSAILATSYRLELVDEFSHEIVIGADDNQRSYIRVPGSDADAVSAITPNILHCHEFRQFWIQWKGHIFELGQGPLIGQQIILQYHEVNWTKGEYTLSLTSGIKSAAIWEVQENSGDLLYMYTPYSFAYKDIWKSVSEKVFINLRLRSCSDAHILLSSEMGGTSGSVYDIILGLDDNTRSVIRTEAAGTGDYATVVEYFGDTVSCLEHRHFWVEWMDGIIRVGRGQKVTSDVLMAYADPDGIDIRYVSVTSTYHEGAHWIFEDSLETSTDILTVQPEPTAYEDIRIVAPQQEFFYFMVTACSDARILLTHTKDEDHGKSYEVILGYGDNKESGIKHLMDTDYLVSAHTADILSCKEGRDFWISWHNGTLKVGKGRIYDYYLILSTLVDLDLEVTYISFASDGRGQWNIKDTVGDHLYLYVDPMKMTSEKVWRTLHTKNDIVFSVKACSNANVILAPSSVVEDQQWHVEVGFGLEDNTKIDINAVKGDDIQHVNGVVLDNILNCTQDKEYWISWYGSVIDVGRGPISGQKSIVSGLYSNIHPFRGVTFGMKEGTTGVGEFHMRENTGDVLYYRTGVDEVRYANWLMMYPFVTSVTFDVVACSDVHVILASDIYDLESNLVEIVISGWNNTKSGIRNVRNGELLAEFSTPDMLSCDSSRSFYISWADGLIQVAKGGVNRYNPVFLSWQNPNAFNVAGLGFDTGPYEGLWIWPENGAAFALFHSPPGLSYERIGYTLEHRQHLIFRVKASENVNIYLTDRVGLLTTYTYEIILGTSQNQESIIRHGFQGLHYIRVPTPDILSSDEFRGFWLTWYQGQIQVGKGLIVGQEAFIDFQELSPRHITAVSFSTSYQEGLWYIPMLEEFAGFPDPPTVEPPSGDGDGKRGLNGGEIAGIVIGSIAGTLLIASIAILVLNKLDFIETPFVPAMFRHSRFDDSRTFAEANHPPRP